MMYIRFPLSLRNVEDLLHERGIDTSHETVRFWWNRFGPMFAAEIRKRRVCGMRSSKWRWHFDDGVARQGMVACLRGFSLGSMVSDITFGGPSITRVRFSKSAGQESSIEIP
jgi:hypothetical protein